MPIQPDTNYSENPYIELFINQKNKHPEISKRSARRRISDLTRLSRALFRNRENFRKALFLDFNKPSAETDITEIYPVMKEIRHAKDQLRNWMRPRNAENGFAFKFTRNKIIYTGKGVCLVLSPWNYPVSLALGPIVSAIAAGNNVIIKPSELTPHTSQLLRKFIGEVFPEDEIAVVEGSSDAAIELLKLPFDHIFFTGGSETGKKVMKAAAENLSTVTLELGGKSPVYVHHDCNIQDAIDKITASKLINCGQTCVAPDYILVHHEVKQELITALEMSFRKYYNNTNEGKIVNYASVINERHYQRLQRLSNSSDSPSRETGLFLKPKLMPDVSMQDPVMKEEIFGPILPVIGVINEGEAVKHIHSLPEPLSIYVFTRDRKVKELFKNYTRSGSICFNDCALHFLHPGLPFGGVGNSGMGRAHGKAGFLEFSNERVIFEQRTGFTMAKMLYPPHGRVKRKLIDWLLKYF